MKRLLLGLLMVMLLVSCHSELSLETAEPTIPAPETDSPRPELPKRLRFIEKSDPPSLHPWVASDERSFLLLGNINSGLFGMDDHQEVSHDLVRLMEVSDDGLEYTFHLKRAYYVDHTGQPVAPITAQDFVYSWKQLASPETDSPHHGLLVSAGIKGTSQIRRLQGILDRVDRQTKQIEELDISDFLDDETGSAQDKFRQRSQALHQVLDETLEAVDEEYGSLEEARDQMSQLIDELGISAIDHDTLRLELERPVPFLKELLCFPAFYPINQAFHETWGERYATSKEAMLYSGPFYLDQWQPNELYSLDRNPEYWQAELVALEGVDLRIEPESTNESLVEAYLNGEIDWTSLTGEKIEKYGNRPDAWYRMDASVIFIEINQSFSADRRYRRLLSDPEARKALHMALDTNRLTEQVLNNGSLAIDTLYPRSFQQLDGRDIRMLDPDYSDGYNLYDPEQAEALWQAAKERAGLSWVNLEIVVADSPNSEKVFEFLKNEWERQLSGTTIELRQTSISDKLKSVEQGNFQLALSAWTPDYPDIMSYAELWTSQSGHNNTGFSDPTYDELINRAKTGDLAAPGKEMERMQVLLEAERILLEDYQVILPLFQRGAIDLLNPGVRNLTVQIVGPRFQFKYVDIE